MIRAASVLPNLSAVRREDATQQINGAAIAVVTQLRILANDPTFDALEVFVAPRDLCSPERLAVWADAILTSDNKGKGRLRFHSIYALPEVWAEPIDRVLYVEDLHQLPACRLIRDRFARSPVVLSVDSHCLGHRSVAAGLREYAEFDTVAYDRLYSPCRAHRTAVLSVHPHLPIQVEVLPRPISESTLRPLTQQEKEQVRDSLGIPREAVVQLYFGRLNPNVKADLFVILDAFAEAASPGSALVFAGVEDVKGYSVALQARARDLGVAKSVFFLGAVDSARRQDTLGMADFFVFPSDTLNEVFGLAAVEALACGLPVIASDWDGLRDTVSPAYGFRVPTYIPPISDRIEGLSPVVDEPTALLQLAQATVIDVGALVNAMRCLYTAETTRLAMAARARVAYEQEFSPEIVAGRWVAGIQTQVAQARNELVEEREARRAKSVCDPRFMAYDELLLPYATQTLSDPLCELTARGRRWQAGDWKPAFYQEAMTVFHTGLLHDVAATLQHGPKTIAELRALSSMPTLGEGDWEFHIFCMAKQGLISITPLAQSLQN